MRSLEIALLGFLLVLPVTTPDSATAMSKPLVAVEIEADVNTIDGCAACGCRVNGELDPGTEREWWISFGLVQSSARTGWSVVDSASRCGRGSFAKIAPDFNRTVGVPYVILDVSTAVPVTKTNDARLEARLRFRKLSGFDEKEKPSYASWTQIRTLGFDDEDQLTIPVLIPDSQEQESFRVHEVLLTTRAALLGRGPAAAYGSISVTADVPGAEILVDYGLVGRIAESRATLVENVLVGKRQVLVRDFSGREAVRQVVVKRGETSEAGLDVLKLNRAEIRDGLISIGKNPQGFDEYWRAKDGSMVVKVPAGEFPMGSPEGQGEEPERPQHRVYVSEFLIDKTEVTWRQFRKFAEEAEITLRSPIWGTPDDYPASFILWEEARSYCEWVGGRLPTEAEWEMAARGPEGSVYPWGDTWDARRCNSISGGLHQPEAVGSYRRCLSPYGVLDMPGGVWEWCQDWYDASYYDESPPRDPQGPDTGNLRVKRGGGWMSQPMWLRSAHRAKAGPTSRNVDNGFRCVQDVVE
jgi:formylglycine-generating enzyme required for sulfatase activity